MATQTVNKEKAKPGVITLKELKAKQPAHLWNVLGADYYRADANIPGSKHVTLEQLAAETKSLPKDADIVVYCGSYQCPTSKQAAEKLADMGFTNVRAYEGGIKEWSESGNPLVALGV